MSGVVPSLTASQSGRWIANDFTPPMAGDDATMNVVAD
jgi:hypothetical protein